MQRTLAKSIKMSGIGLHSGREVFLDLLPAEINSGVLFYLHEQNDVHCIRLDPSIVSSTELATTLSADDHSVSTVEHLLAALSGLQIDNVECHIYQGEIPILDGSAMPFVSSIYKAGVKEFDFPRRVAKISREFFLEDQDRSIRGVPYDGFYIDYYIEFAHPCIGKQHFEIAITPESFSEEIALARTFGFEKDVQFLNSHNLALGGSLDNVVVIGEHSILNKDGLRRSDEFVRHKILDFIGDMSMMGHPLYGKFFVRKSGHQFNNLFLRKLKAENAYIETEEV